MLAAILTGWGALRGVTGGITLKGLGIAAGVAVALALGWGALSFAKRAAADRAAVVSLTTQRDQAVAAANQNAAALAEAARKNDDVLRAAQAAAADASARSDRLAADLEEIRNEAANCTPAGGPDPALQRLR